MPARALMFQGTGSDVGKSLIVAGLARAFAARGLAVRPFKPQNMSNNAAVTADGGEIGRAQALQARAAQTAPSVHMNPVLLKPQSEIGAQIVVQGRVYGSAKAAAYQQMKRELMPFVLDSFARLRGEADIVLVEGAGSAAEVNLRANDIANMGFARAAEVPVVVIGDIDRGGVIASLVGTKAVLPDEDAALVRGFIVNKFRGDAALFAAGMERIAQATGWEALGLVPYFADARLLPAEDALALEQTHGSGSFPAPAGIQACKNRGADPAAHRQLRRPRSARGRARGRSGARAAGCGAPRRCRSRGAARLEGDDRGSCGSAQRRLRHRHRRASAPRRFGPRPLRRLSDARAHDRRPRRHRRSARNGRRARAHRCRDHAVGQQSASNRCADRRATAPRLPVTRCIWA